MIMALQQYDYTIRYRPGRIHDNADTMSRRPYPKTTETMDTDDLPPFKNMMAYVVKETKMTAVQNDVRHEPQAAAGIFAVTGTKTPDLSKVKMSELQQKDTDCALYMDYIRDRKTPDNEQDIKRLRMELNDYCILDEHLYHFWYPKGSGFKADRCIKQLVVPKSMRHAILSAMHDDTTAGHFGVAQTLATIRTRYYWEGMTAT
eukprot:GHVR01060554.1.p1 GENE.GHVR01060554.1~~GHVR01060554.1.p1  ORF type:complete len:203 (+),score=13.62 GHVR01060554.1:692-1300(+)